MSPKIISIIQIIISAMLVFAVLIQQKGSGGIFGGGEGMYHAKRGFEKFLFIATIILAVLFIASSIAALLIR